MSPTRLTAARSAAVQATLVRLWGELGQRVRAERIRRSWSTQTLADRAGVSRWAVYLVERGESGSLEVGVRCLSALGLRLELDAIDPRKRSPSAKRAEDPVHAAMGEFEAGHLRKLGYSVAIDEPYQHFQLAGRADVLAWSTDRAALLHLENRTQFPNYQEAAGAYNAKRAYLAPILAERLGFRRFTSVTHVLVCFWSSEVLHSIRLRQETFRALAPDTAQWFREWWAGAPPRTGTTSTLVVLDPAARGRERQWIDLASALSSVRPRYRGYAEAAARLAASAA